MSWKGGSWHRDPPKAPQIKLAGLNFFDFKILCLASILITMGISWIVLGLQCALVLIYLSLRLLIHTSITQVDLGSKSLG